MIQTMVQTMVQASHDASQLAMMQASCSYDTSHVQAERVYLATQVVYILPPPFEHLLETFRGVLTTGSVMVTVYVE